MNFTEYKNRIEEINTRILKEFSGIRTGAASINVLDNVMIEVYESKMPINQLANLGIQDAKSLLITPFDFSIIKNLEKGLSDANLGLNISASSDGIRLSFPELTSDRRVMLMKIVKEKLENAKINLRRERDEIWKEIQENEKKGEIGEDQKFVDKEQMEDITKEATEKLDKFFLNKEKEISK